MAAALGHAHAHDLTGRTAFFLTAIILVVELTGGLLSHSLALLSDAGHVLTDIVPQEHAHEQTTDGLNTSVLASEEER
jgi:Co/Zn/Cd efflux system component